MTVLQAWTKLCQSGEVTPLEIADEVHMPSGGARMKSRRCELWSMGGTYLLAFLEQRYATGTLHVASVGQIRLDDVQPALDPWHVLTSRLDQQRQRSCDIEAARILAKQP